MEKGDEGGEEIEGIEGWCGWGHGGSKKTVGGKENVEEKFFLQADVSNFVQENLEVKDQNFGERYLALAKDFGKNYSWQ